LHRCAGYP